MELLIVIVVIAILAAIVIVAYNGVQDRARNSKISNDLAQFDKAIRAARVNSNEQALRYITNSVGTSNNCVYTDATTDLADKTAAASCWSAYQNTLNAISIASGMNIRTLVDPWGRPYFLDENEKEGAGVCGNGPDVIGTFPRQRTQGSWATDKRVTIPYVTPGC